MSISNVRSELPSDNFECSKRCVTYHHDFVPRIYDTKMSENGETKNISTFKTKYCICGPEVFTNTFTETKEKIVDVGFQVCTGLKCKQRCGMRDAICEPKYRRACLCQRQNIFIGPHLWSRLPTSSEIFCYRTCFAKGLHARVIEKNPLLKPEAERFEPWYRKSIFQYQYDGKFCHCIKLELDLNEYRPCSDELCRWICGHTEAVCDKQTRRNCICNTHRLLTGLGRKPDSGEIKCDVTCRFNLLDGRILDVSWKTKNKCGWGITKSKYCGCVRPVSAAGLTHCEGGVSDRCPKFCSNPAAYCTREKYCECGIIRRLLNSKGLRLPTGREAEECSEKCTSWMWPIAADSNNEAYIYDEGIENCFQTRNCSRVDTTPWSPSTPGALSTSLDALDDSDVIKPKKFCLCARSKAISYSPGTRFLPMLVPHRAPRGLDCVGNHTCIAVGNGVAITT